jgi:hypothetical protein
MQSHQKPFGTLVLPFFLQRNKNKVLLGNRNIIMTCDMLLPYVTSLCYFLMLFSLSIIEKNVEIMRKPLIFSSLYLAIVLNEENYTTDNPTTNSLF